MLYYLIHIYVKGVGANKGGVVSIVRWASWIRFFLQIWIVSFLDEHQLFNEIPKWFFYFIFLIFYLNESNCCSKLCTCCHKWWNTVHILYYWFSISIFFITRNKLLHMLITLVNLGCYDCHTFEEVRDQDCSLIGFVS